MKRDHDIVQQLDLAEDAFRRSRLRTMQRVAFGLFVTAVAMFMLARTQQGGHPAWGYLEAFAEAAMVGAIADWFAVVALFRHPLGVPLWHTAIIPNSKDQIGNSLGRFVENHFITEEGIVGRICLADFARHIGEWLLHPTNAQAAGRASAGLLRQALQNVDDAKIRRLVREFAIAELGRLDLASLTAGGIDALVAQDKPQQLLIAVLSKLSDWLDDHNNHDVIASFLLRSLDVQNPLVKAAVNSYVPNAIASLLEQIAAVRRDPGHPLRTQVSASIGEGILRLKADPDWQHAIARYQKHTLNDEQVQQGLGGLWDALRVRLLDDLQRDESDLAATIQSILEQSGRLLVSDPAARSWLDASIEAMSRMLVRRYRGEVGAFIEQQLAQWTKEQMSTRIELAIGRDLQFIRINGTLVGGLVGLLIHALTMAL
jgi:uncharacterized membrane-anchored protein YjiN (DUF445 family)